MANAEEYWAEGVQSYFDANKTVDPPNGIHNAIDTRAKLKEYDRDLFSLIDAAFKATAWRSRRPDLGLLPRPGCRLQSETYVVPSESGGEPNVKVVRCLPVPGFSHLNLDISQLAWESATTDRALTSTHGFGVSGRRPSRRIATQRLPYRRLCLGLPICIGGRVPLKRTR
jgi:hypothetical protein